MNENNIKHLMSYIKLYIFISYLFEFNINYNLYNTFDDVVSLGKEERLFTRKKKKIFFSFPQDVTVVL